MQNKMIMDYLRGEILQTEKVALQNIEKFQRHPDIMSEFSGWIKTREFPSVAITVEGYTAEKINRTSYLSELGAYNYLIYLREKPDEALKNLKAGLPRK